MTDTRPTINHILTQFFAAEAEGMKGVRRQRVDRVERALRNCLESEGHRVLIDRDRAVLHAEREFDPDDAFARMMHADDLVFALPLFLEPLWLRADPSDRRIQLALVDKLTGYLLRGRLIDGKELACPLLDIWCAVERARAELRRERMTASAESGMIA